MHGWAIAQRLQSISKSVLQLGPGQRTREFGVRMALGAARSQLLSLVLKRGIALAVTGLALGLVGALALTRVLAGLLY